jgi:heme a synthase
MTPLRATTAVAIALTFALIVLGAWVRATDSGLSCPDWPTCYGHWVPLPGDIPADAGYAYYQVMLEWVHRLIAGVILGPLVLVIVWLSWRARALRPRLPLYAGVLLALLVVQGGIGALTVLDQNSPWSVALHLTVALLFFSVLWLIFERARPDEPAGAGVESTAALAVVVWLVAIATMASAAMVAKTGAAFACGSWPLCNGALIPDLADPSIRLHFSHRLLAAATTVGVLGLLLVTRRQREIQPVTAAALILIVLAVLLGGVLVLTGMPILMAILHQALGILTFALITLAMWRCLGSPARREEPLHVRVSRARGAL